MDTNQLFNVPFNGETYSLTFDQVKELQKIKEYCGSNIKLLIKFNDSREIVGNSIEIVKGESLLFPGDEFVPTIFKIETSESIEELNFLEIESITLID